MNYTLVKNEENKTVCAKRIEKKEWYKKITLVILQQNNVAVKEYYIENAVVMNNNDHSFIEEDMLSKSFIANNTSQFIEQQNLSEDLKIVQQPYSQADEDFSRASSREQDML